MMAARAALHHLGEGLALVGVEDRTHLLEGVQSVLHRLREQGLYLGLLGLQDRVIGPVQRQAAQLGLRGVQGPIVLPLGLDVTVRVDLAERLHLVLGQSELLLQVLFPARAPVGGGRGIGGVEGGRRDQGGDQRQSGGSRDVQGSHRSAPPTVIWAGSESRLAR
jgi:hypothetical protein